MTELSGAVYEDPHAPLRTSETIQERESSFIKSDNLSSSFTDLLQPKFAERGIGSDSKLACSVHVNERSDAVQQILQDVDLTKVDLHTFLDIARARNLNVSLYVGGIAWTGDTGNPHEASDVPGGSAKYRLEQLAKKLVSLSEEMSPEEKAEKQLLQKGKLPALEFLGRSGTDICITIDPAADNNMGRFLSSLRADAAAKSVVFDTLSTHQITSCETVYWSNGALKEFQIHRAACETIAADLLWVRRQNIVSNEELLAYAQKPNGYQELLTRIAQERTARDNMSTKTKKKVKRDDVFDNGEQAYAYLKKLRGKNIILGGAPATLEDLALPFKLTHSTPLFREINDGMRRIVNRLIIGGIGKIDKIKDLQLKRGPVSNVLLSRLAEMGRARNLDPNLIAELQLFGIWEMVFNIMQGAVGDARILSLADTSGKVVLSDRHSPAKGFDVMYGKNIAIPIETVDAEVQFAPIINPSGKEVVEVSGQSQHGELKRPGVINRIRDIAAWSRMHPGLDISSRFNKGRYRVIANLDIFSISDRLVRQYS